MRTATMMPPNPRPFCHYEEGLVRRDEGERREHTEMRWKSLELVIWSSVVPICVWMYETPEIPAPTFVSPELAGKGGMDVPKNVEIQNVQTPIPR